MAESPAFYSWRPAPSGPPVQLPLFPDLQRWSRWVLKLHETSIVHYDFRLEMLGVLLSFVLLEPPSLDPDRWIEAKLVRDHDVKHIFSEHRIPAGSPGAGVTIPVDGGHYAPKMRKYVANDLEMLSQIGDGEVQIHLEGHHLQGGWQLRGEGEEWQIRKLPDEHASWTRVLSLDRSFLTGKGLSDY